MKLAAKIVLLCFVLFLVNIPIYQGGSDIWNADMQVHLQKCTGKCNRKYCNISSVCTPVNRTSKIKSLDIYLQPGVNLQAPIYIEIIANKKFRTEYRQFMMHVKEELCSLLLYKNHSLFKLADSGLLKRIKNGVYGNLLDPCPFAGHRFLKPRTTNSQDDAYHLPLIPVGDWRLDVKLTKNGEHLLSFSDFYEVKATGATEF